MPSYTSNFDREIPKGNFKVAMIASLLIATIFIIGYELYWRSNGYTPTFNDDKYQWSIKRNQIKANDLVIVGSSRSLFDLDLATIQKATSIKPVQLSIVGSDPLLVLEDLAYDPSFKGTIICGIVPGLFFAPPHSPPFKKAEEWDNQAKKMSPVDYSNTYLNKALELNLAYLQQEDLPLKELLKTIPISNRPNKSFQPKLPPYFYNLSWDRKANMIQKVTDDENFAKSIQSGWIPFFTPPPFDKSLTPEDIGKMIEGLRQMVLSRAKAAVEAQTKKGGHVLFLRLPSVGVLRNLENKFTPRVRYWDTLIQTTGTKGYHFEDYETLKYFNCPEWSHLSQPDSVKYTEELLKIIGNLK